MGREKKFGSSESNLKSHNSGDNDKDDDVDIDIILIKMALTMLMTLMVIARVMMATGETTVAMTILLTKILCPRSRRP